MQGNRLVGHSRICTELVLRSGFVEKLTSFLHGDSKALEAINTRDGCLDCNNLTMLRNRVDILLVCRIHVLGGYEEISRLPGSHGATTCVFSEVVVCSSGVQSWTSTKPQGGYDGLGPRGTPQPPNGVGNLGACWTARTGWRVASQTASRNFFLLLLPHPTISQPPPSDSARLLSMR